MCIDDSHDPFVVGKSFRSSANLSIDDHLALFASAIGVDPGVDRVVEHRCETAHRKWTPLDFTAAVVGTDSTRKPDPLLMSPAHDRPYSRLDLETLEHEANRSLHCLVRIEREAPVAPYVADRRSE